MIKILLLLLVVGAVIWIWLNHRERLLKALNRAVDVIPDRGGGSSGADLAGPRRQEIRGSGPLNEAPRKLSPLDVSTIQARFEKLGIWKVLNEYQAETLRRLVLEACKEGMVALWWSPLEGLARHLDYGKGEVPVVIMDASLRTVVQVRRNLLALDYQLRGSFRLDDVRGDDGAEFEADKVLEDGRYCVIYRVKDRAYRFPLKVDGGLVDVFDLVGRVNGLLGRRQAADRLLLLPPEGAVWCIVCCLFSTAEQVHRAGWGQLVLPPEGGECDEEAPSAVLPEK